MSIRTFNGGAAFPYGTTWTQDMNWTVGYALPRQPINARLVFDDIPAAVAPLTEVERLVTEVESVCALAR